MNFLITIKYFLIEKLILAKMSSSRKSKTSRQLDFTTISGDVYDTDGSTHIDFENQDISNKLYENQRLGFKLADEIRSVRQALSEERQQKRLLVVTNENLNEQIQKLEAKIRLLEQKHEFDLETTDHAQQLYEDEVRKTSYFSYANLILKYIYHSLHRNDNMVN